MTRRRGQAEQHNVITAPAPAADGDVGKTTVFPLAVTDALWIIGEVLYPPCAWFARVKSRRHDWWLSYLCVFLRSDLSNITLPFTGLHPGNVVINHASQMEHVSVQSLT